MAELSTGLYSVFSSAQALQDYAVSKAHVDVVNNNVKPNIEGDFLAFLDPLVTCPLERVMLIRCQISWRTTSRWTSRSDTGLSCYWIDHHDRRPAQK